MAAPTVAHIVVNGNWFTSYNASGREFPGRASQKAVSDLVPADLKKDTAGNQLIQITAGYPYEVEDMAGLLGKV